MRLHVLLLTLLLAPAAARADHDGDPIDDGLEPLACGQPDVASVVAALGGAAGRCRPGYDYHHDLLTLQATCSGSQCSAPLHRSSLPLPYAATPAVAVPPDDVEPLGPIPVPFLDPDTVVLHGYRGDGNDYCLRVESADAEAPEPACVNLSGFAGLVPPIGPQPLMPYDDLGYTPGAEEGGLATVPARSTAPFRLETTVTAHWDESRLARRVDAGGVEAWEPVDALSLGALSWWAAHGEETRLEVSWRLVDLEGTVRSEGSRSVPHVGQAVAAAHRTGA